MSLVVVGSVAYDGVETPHGKVDRMLGGACTYISLAASYFTDVNIVAALGDNDRAMLLYEMETAAFGTLRAMEYFVVRDGQLVTDTLVFDTHAVREVEGRQH